MTIERKPISEFRKATLNAQWPTETETDRLGLHPNTIIFRNLETGEICGQVNADDLFDADGNRFWLDA